MQKEILSESQEKLLPLVKRFKRNYYLVSATAVALYIGHRKSLDFDLFTALPLTKKKITNEIKKLNLEVKPLYFDGDQQHYLINGVKCTFFYYPYPLEHSKNFGNHLSSFFAGPGCNEGGIGKKMKMERLCGFVFYFKRILHDGANY